METKNRDYKFLRVIIGTIARIYYAPKIINKKVIPESGPIIVAGNHRHATDQYLAGISTKRVLRYMAKREYFDGTQSLFGNPTKPSKLGCKVSKFIVETAGCIRVDRDIKDVTASEQALEVLKQGGAVGIFP